MEELHDDGRENRTRCHSGVRGAVGGLTPPGDDAGIYISTAAQTEDAPSLFLGLLPPFTRIPIDCRRRAPPKNC